jgi:hypothetical protein
MKSAIVRQIATSIGPTMVRLDAATNTWYLLGKKDSREKVGQIIRLMASKIQPSNSNGRAMENLYSPSGANKSASWLDEITSVESPLSSQSSPLGKHVLEKEVGSTSETIAVLPDSTTLSSTTLLEPSKNYDFLPYDVVPDISPRDWFPQEVSSSIPPCLTHQSSTDWFHEDEMDLSFADLADTEVFEDFFETFALAA